MTKATENFNPRERLESDTEGILRQFLHGVPWCVRQVERLLPDGVAVVVGDTRPDAWRQTIKTYVSSVFYGNKKYEILTRTVAPVVQYITSNDGWSATGDPYKIAYWYGVELSKELHKVSPHAAMVAMVATVELLNSFLSASKGKPHLHEQMMSKIRKSIVEERWQTDYGLYGIYFTFKGLAKADCSPVGGVAA